MPDDREEECAYTFPVVLGIENVLNLSLFKSYDSEVLACCRWYLYVRPCVTNRSFHACPETQGYTSSWEFLITLDLDWNVIRGRRSYQRTYWVCNDRSFCFQELISVVVRLTSLPALQPSRL